MIRSWFSFFAVLIAASMASAALRPEIVSGAEISSRARPFQSQAGVRLDLMMDPAEAQLRNPGFSDRFVAADPQLVNRILSEMQPLGGPDIALRIYCLPGLPVGHRASFTVGSEVFLIPALATPSETAIAYALVHEVGHVFQNLRMPQRRGAQWLEYLRMRRIEDTSRYHAAASHRDRPAEIFAEDFRALFGGPTSTSTRTLENPTLAYPDEVIGLAELFLRIAASEAKLRAAAMEVSPNPCNPKTTIRAVLPELALLPGAWATATVYDLRGRQIRKLSPQPVAEAIEFQFDGRDASGARLSSGCYLVRIVAPAVVLSSTVTLVQ